LYTHWLLGSFVDSRLTDERWYVLRYISWHIIIDHVLFVATLMVIITVPYSC